jgi:rhodanese-related sulfurtransferase
LTDSISIRADSTALSDVFVEPAWLAEHLNDPSIRVVEVDVSRAAYNQGHIPGAVLWNAYADRQEFEELLSRSGLAPDATIVFYGYGHYLGCWLMKAYGHERALVLRGTRDNWRDAGRPWTTDFPNPVASTYTLPEAEATQLMSLNALQGALGTGNPVILDGAFGRRIRRGAVLVIGRHGRRRSPWPHPQRRASARRPFAYGRRRIQERGRGASALTRPRSGPRAQRRHLLHHRHPGERGSTGLEVSTGVSRRPHLLRLLG